MDLSDREHLEEAVRQLHLFLLSGLIVTEDDQPFSPEFINSASSTIGKGMNELAQVSPEFKEKHQTIDWELVEKFRDPLMARDEMIENLSWFRKEMRDEIPANIEIVKRILDEEK